MPFTEDLTPFFNTAEFASAATLDGLPVNGIFDDDYYEALGNAVQGSAPTFLLPTASAAGIAHGDTLIIDSAVYKVRGVEPDGTGTTRLRLEKQ